MAQERMEGSKPKSIFSGLAHTAPKVEATVQSAKAITDKVRVVHGSNDGYFPMVGKTVGDVRKGLKDTFNLPGDANAEVDGKQVGDDFILGAGQNLEFSKAAGTKGDDSLITEVVGSDDDAEFNAWCDEIDTLAREDYDFQCDITKDTGRDCWYDYYTEGYTPQEAFEEDMSNA